MQAEAQRGTWARLTPFLGLCGACSFSFGQPILATAGNNPQLFLQNSLGRAEMVVFALLVLVALPAALWVLVRLVGRIHEEAGQRLLAFFVGVAALLTVARLLAPSGSAWLAWGAALAAGILLAVGVRRVPVIQEWLAFTAGLVLVTLAWFFMASESANLLRSPEEIAASLAIDSPPVVFLILDELPTQALLDDQGGIDAEAYPNFARLAGGSTWYSNYTAMNAFTDHAIPSILAGSRPRVAEPLWTEYPDNLFRLLAPTHELVVFESPTHLCGVTTCGEISSASGTVASPSAEGGVWDFSSTLLDFWRVGLSGEERTEAERFADFEELPATESALALDNLVESTIGVPERFERFLAELRPTDRSSLYFLHLLLPHSPFTWFPDGERYQGPLLALGSEHPWLVQLDERRHLYQVRYVDRLLGVLLDTLSEQGLYEEALIVVVSDHGKSFVAGEHARSLAPAAQPSVAYVPLFVKEPGQSAPVNDPANVMAMDVLPIVAEALGTTIPWPVDGAIPQSNQVSERGTTKEYYDVIGAAEWFENPHLTEARFFDAADVQPAASNRWIGADAIGRDDLNGLFAYLANTSLIGAAAPAADGQERDATVVGLAEMRAGSRQLAVEGSISLDEPAGEVLVVVDDVIVSGSPVISVGGSPSFIAPLPQRLVGEALDFALLHVADDGSVSPVRLQG